MKASSHKWGVFALPFSLSAMLSGSKMRLLRLRAASLVCRDTDRVAVWRELYGIAETIYRNSLMTTQVFSMSVTKM